MSKAKKKHHDTSLGKRLKKNIPFYFFLLPAVVFVYLFSYRSLGGIAIAFKDFKMARGIADSPSVGWAHFERMFSDPNFYRVLKNTIKISFLTLLTQFPLTIIFTLLVNEIHNIGFKRTIQSITYLPNFLSWVVVGSFVYQILSPSSGIVNAVLLKLGWIDKPIYFMATDSYFVQIYLITMLWKNTGYSIVIYLATIASIDTSLYEAATIDGANRFQRVIYITLPAMYPLMSTMLVLSIGSILTVGFDPIYNLANSATYDSSDVISTYVYRKGMVESQYDYTTAIGLFQNVVSLALVLFANVITRKLDPEYRII